MTQPAPTSKITSRRITEYETVDGKRHSTRQSARIHTIKLELRGILRELLTAPPYESQLEIEYVADALLENPKQIATLLQRYNQLQQLTISKPESAA